MVDLSGPLTMFVGSVVNLVSLLLAGMLGWMTDLLSGIAYFIPSYT